MILEAYIISQSGVVHTLTKKNNQSSLKSTTLFIVPLKFTFQSPENLYFVSLFVNSRGLFYYLQNEKRFDMNRSRLCTAKLFYALECLYSFNIIYRDLKPQNILLDYLGHISLSGFSLYKLDIKDKDSTTTFCRTLVYRPLELLLSQGYTKTVD
jgi:serum/glucocorticoid-regulated kinase 2